MTELIIKMILCLVIALLLGFLIGWLLSKVAQAKRHIVTLDKLNNNLIEKDNEVSKLKSDYLDKKSMLLKLSADNRELTNLLDDKSKLLDKSSFDLNHVQQELNIAQNTVTENFTAKEHNQALVQQVNNLEKLYLQKNNEIKELEEVLIKAEDKREEMYQLLLNKEEDMKLQHSEDTQDLETITTLEDRIEKLLLNKEENTQATVLYQKTISDLEEELKLYVVEGEESEFIISKDQFTHIEDQLVQYQKEIEILKEEKKGLLVKGNEVEVSKPKDATSELDDIAIVKLFRDTYKKITKS